MDCLPQDIIDEISSYFNEDFDRPTLASISTRWQLAVERQTFHSIELTSEEVTEFDRILARAHRISYLNKLRFNVVLPAYQESQRCMFENSADRAIN
ncbi:hypothetical protein Micbo1qcDRAFT_165878, partial [Microdochium bolleyi]